MRRNPIVRNLCVRIPPNSLATEGCERVHEARVEKDLSLSIEKVAKMEVSWGRGAEGTMLFVTDVCGVFLFALMSAQKQTRIWLQLSAEQVLSLVTSFYSQRQTLF